MSMELTELTKALCALPGPAGFESPVSGFLADYLAPFADEVRVDVMGSLTAVKRCGKEGAKTLLLDAHIDEVGLVITAAEDGFLRFAALGGVDPRILPASEVRILGTEGELFGVISSMPPHVLKAGDSDKAMEIDKLRIDAGLTPEEAERLVPPGTPAVLSVGCEAMGESALCGRAIDDRSCAAILVKAFEELSCRELSVDLCLLLSTQEEVGGRGAVTAAFAASPDYAVSVDVTFDRTSDGKRVFTECGKGAAIGVGPNMDRAMTREMIRTAEANGIPYQIEVCPGSSGTNIEDIQITRAGVVTALASLPIRYMHTPAETVRTEDMQSVLRLVTEFASSMEVGR